MDLTKFKERYPLFLSLMKERGYSEGYIRKFERMARLILSEGDDESIHAYEQFYYYMARHHFYTEGTNIEYRNLIGRLKVFVEDGIFLGDTGKASGFLIYKSYDHLSSDFKCLVDNYVNIERKRGKLKESTIANVVYCISSFLYSIQKTGVMTLSGIKNPETILRAFNDGKQSHRGYSVAKAICSALKACMHLYPDGECKRIWAMIPEFPRRTRLYDNLQPEENKKVAAALNEPGNRLTYRSKAIGKLAYYTGMRRIDIANLHLENISFEKDEITFIQQKTGLEVRMPLRPVVGNAIYDYLVNERPQSSSDHIFIRIVRPFIEISPSGLAQTSENIFREADIRREKGRKKGFHLFRHSFASGLIGRNVPGHIVSELLGHASRASINPYLDADIEHLRECALSIGHFSKIRDPEIASFRSPVRETIQRFAVHCVKQGIWSADYNKSLHGFDNYCSTFYPNAHSFSQGMFNKWCEPLEGESNKAYLRRASCINDFISYLSATYGLPLKMPELKAIKKRARNPLSKTYVSAGAVLFEQFVSHRKNSGRWSDVYDRNLRSFDMHCATKYPKATILTREMVDTWCEKRQSENQCSRNKRVAVVNSFLKYTLKRGLLDLGQVSTPSHRLDNITIKEPHAFTDTELENFFHACDHIQINRNGIKDRLMKLTIPVFFRLLYSSGMRTNEARNLDVEDVDLKYGIINIRHTKGYIEHRVALHSTMKERLVEYDASIGKLMPGRKCFFPNYLDNYYSLAWMDYNFERLWFKYNHNPATAYHLRHHFATTNINNWPAQAEKFNRNLLYLSRSMGHSILETTMYYYNFTPKLTELLKERKNETFNDIIPNRAQYFKNDED